MKHKSKIFTYWLRETDEEVSVEYNFFHGTSGTYEDPGEDDEVEILAVLNEKNIDILHSLSKCQLERIEESIIENASNKEVIALENYYDSNEY